MRVNGALYYDLRDNLGSAAEVMDASGNIVGQERYYPFGGTRVTTGSVNTDRLYTGQRSLAALSLMDYHARFYEPTLGVFIQPDPMMPGASNPQSFNRYSYVLNNPINLNDPSGYKPCWATKNYTCHHVTPKQIADSYNNAPAIDKPAVVAFFASQGWSIGSSSGNNATNTYCSQNAWDCNGAFFGTGGGNVGSGSVSSIGGSGQNSGQNDFGTYMLNAVAFGGETQPITIADSNPLNNSRVSVTFGGWIGNDNLLITPFDQGIASPSIWATKTSAGISTGVMRNDSFAYRENLGIGVEGSDIQIKYEVELDQNLSLGGIYSKIGLDASIHSRETAMALIGGAVLIQPETTGLVYGLCKVSNFC
jgi:RHS repeat-associated protein